jgi:hypothetical protein
MKIEFLKLIKNIPILSILIFWIIISVLNFPRSQTKFSILEIFEFNGIVNNANPFVFIFNSVNAYISVIIIPVICHLAFIKDAGIYKAARAHFLKKSLFIITFFKLLAIGTILALTYLVIFLIYCIVIYYRFDVSLLKSIALITFFYLKFVCISTLFSYFLLLLQSLISYKRTVLYYAFYLLGLGSLAISIEFNYTPFNWFVNGLGYFSRLHSSKSFQVAQDFNSELLMASLVSVLCLIFYFLYERRKVIY